MAGIPVKPMLASPQGAYRISEMPGYAFDVKLDGVRAILTWENGTLTITNRNGQDRTTVYPDLTGTCPLPVGTSVVMDGEIIAANGSFESIARRDKNTKPTQQLMTDIPVQFLAFDVLFLNGTDLRGLPWSERRSLLETLMDAVSHPNWGLTVVSNQPTLFQSVRDLGMEGVIAKQTTSRYKAGRSSAWVKFKVTHRVTCIAVGYEPGEGSRSHFGAMFLAMLDEHGKPVEVGRVGTGFSTADTHECKRLLDARTPFLVEIECANVTKSGVLRFPSYKGLRTDLELADAQLTQLDTIPRS